jgi:hypothetical protein
VAKVRLSENRIADLVAEGLEAQLRETIRQRLQRVADAVVNDAAAAIARNLRTRVVEWQAQYGKTIHLSLFVDKQWCKTEFMETRR